MLEFFRKYQRYFFFVITFVVIISFSFFGTYSAVVGSNYHEQEAFKKVDGTSVTRGQLEQMVLFLGTDANDKLLFGGQWGPNFLNDGVITADLLKTGLAAELAQQYAGDIQQELQSRLEKERRYRPYVHPQAPFLGVMNAWNYVAPGMKDNFDRLRLSPSPLTPEAFEARINLYIGQRQFPALAMRQLLSYQQKQYAWLAPDPALEQTDFSLFGYHTLDDWFGPRFMRLISQFIMNSAAIAEQKGYRVSKQEALADLMNNAELSYRQNLKNPYLGVTNSTEYFNEQLNRMGLDANQAAALWQQVLLFRRLFRDAGESVFVDPLAFQKLNEYSLATVEGDVYQLPSEFRFNSFHDLQQFEVYLNAISKRPEDDKGILNLPMQFYSPEEVAKKTPELVQKQYLLDIAKIDKSILEAKVTVKDMWNWEVDHWDALTKLFPDLGTKKSETREERFAALDSLDDKNRSQVDAYARSQMVDQHPEWLTQALQNAPSEKVEVNLRLQGGKTPFAGLAQREELFKLLDQAKLNEQDPSLDAYSADNRHYYRVKVIDRSPAKEISSFGKARDDGILDQLVDKELESYYQKNLQEFQNKPFEEVRGAVSEQAFAKILKAIKADYGAAIAPKKAPQHMLTDIAASLRFHAYTRNALAAMKKDPQAGDRWIKKQASNEGENKLASSISLGDQWKFEKKPYRKERGEEAYESLFSLTPSSWSKVLTPVNGDISFVYIQKIGSDANAEALAKTVQKARTLLSDEVQMVLMNRLIADMKSKKALSLEFMNKAPEAETVP